MDSQVYVSENFYDLILGSVRNSVREEYRGLLDECRVDFSYNFCQLSDNSCSGISTYLWCYFLGSDDKKDKLYGSSLNVKLDVVPISLNPRRSVDDLFCEDESSSGIDGYQLMLSVSKNPVDLFDLPLLNEKLLKLEFDKILTPMVKSRTGVSVYARYVLLDGASGILEF